MTWFNSRYDRATWVTCCLLMLCVQAQAAFHGGPLSTDPAGGDFSFRPGSPALALGIEPLDTAKMGLIKEKNNGE